MWRRGGGRWRVIEPYVTHDEEEDQARQSLLKLDERLAEPINGSCEEATFVPSAMPIC